MDQIPDVITECGNEPALAKLRLSKDVSHAIRKSSGKPFVMVSHSVMGHFYRMGIMEWQIAKLFDGCRTLRQVVAEATSLHGEEKVKPATVSRLAAWLLQNDLAELIEGSLQPTNGSKPTSSKLSSAVTKLARLGAWNPLFMKMPLPNPQSALRALMPLLGWTFSLPFFVVWLLACAYAGYCVVAQWARFQTAFDNVFSPDQWLHLLVVWLVLKVLHEVGHAICCMRFGGNVTRWGLMFIVFSPIAWVDVTSAWSFRSKWKRIMVSLAGMYVEFFLAAIAAIVWASTTSAEVATVARNVVVSATLTTLLFNLNFLMRFDGYFVLTDLLGLENLYGSGQKYIQYFQQRYLLGMPATPLKLLGWKLHFVRLYAVAAMIWRLVFYVGLVIVASHLFHGAGLLLGIFSGVLWFGLPLARILITIVTHRNAPNGPKPLQFASICIVGCLLLVGGMMLPWPGSTKAWGVIEYAPLRNLRVDRPGFVQDIHVEPGDQVEAGQPLLTLGNPELVRELADLDLQLKIQEIQRRVMHRDDDMATYTAVRKKVESLREQRDQLARQVQSLTMRAPIAGTVIADDLESLLGKFLDSGDDLLAVGSTGKKEVRISISQHVVETFRSATDGPVQLSFLGHRLSSNSATLARVNPRATRGLLHPALSATLGGPLAVQTSNDESGEPALSEAHFEGVIDIPVALSTELHPGEVCSVSLGRGRQRVFEKIWSLGRAYFERKAEGTRY